MALSNTNILNFSIGPVQGFIARARKTRDFWAGSFLLSYLAGQAMAVILENGGKLILPVAIESKENISDPLLRVIIEGKNRQLVSRQDRINLITATLPNRFRAEIPADFKPALCVQAVEEKWSELTKIIWDRYLAGPAALGHSTAEIWQRQIDNFWEINWIIGEDPAVLDLRKNWRSHIPSFEHGDKCTLFGDLQELSGYLRIREPEKQGEFWQAVRQQKRAGIYYDLEENELLCAIALIKRLFPHVIPELITCQVPVNYPSTPYLAAVNWIGEVIREKPEEARSYYALASSLPEVKGRENPDLFPELQKELAKHPQARDFAALEGNCFFKAALENPNLWDRPSAPASRSKELRKKLVNKLKEFPEPPSPFYAMLLMDGDRLGALLQKYAAKAGDISSALNRFSLQVPQLIKEGNGITVYAGGDDVLALLPLENALATAIKLRSAYLEAFSGKLDQCTISGAIVYTHYNTPLTEVYLEAQHLLSDVAKEKTGRDSLAITIWKSAGKVLTWAAPWDSFICAGGKGNKIDNFVQSFREEITSKEDKAEAKLKEKPGEFSNTFFYNLQTRLALLSDETIEFPGSDKSETELLLKEVLIAEYMKSGVKPTREEAQVRMSKLLDLCRRAWKDAEGKVQYDHKLYLNSIFLVKFLVEKGVEK